MKHQETISELAQPRAGHFFCPLTGPLILPSPQWGAGELAL